MHSKGFLFLLLDWVPPTSRKQEADEDPPKHVCGDMGGMMALLTSLRPPGSPGGVPGSSVEIFLYRVLLSRLVDWLGMAGEEPGVSE